MMSDHRRRLRSPDSSRRSSRRKARREQELADAEAMPLPASATFQTTPPDEAGGPIRMRSEPVSIRGEPQPPPLETTRPRGERGVRGEDSSSSSYSSSSSSYLDISRRYPRRGGIFRTFFSAPAEHKHRYHTKKKKKTKFLGFGRNSSSSSVNSDLAYGTGFIKKPKSRGPTTPIDVGAPPRPDRYHARSSGLNRKSSEEEILRIGQELAKVARDQNREDLRMAGRSQPSKLMSAASQFEKIRRQNTGESLGRGIGASKPHHGSSGDEDSEWESASEDESSSDFDSGLAYGASTLSLAASRPPQIISQKPPEGIRPPDRKSSVVDPKMFGPVNSLRGYVQTPCGFPENTRPTNQQFTAPSVAPIAPVNSASIEARPMQRVYPMPTSDPANFDASRGSIVSVRQDFPVVSRPAPVPIQAPKPIVPVSPRVFEEDRYKSLERQEARRARRQSDGKSFGEAAAIGAAATAGIAAAAAIADRRDKRDDRRERDRDPDEQRERDERRRRELEREIEKRERELAERAERRRLDRERDERRDKEGRRRSKRDVPIIDQEKRPSNSSKTDLRTEGRPEKRDAQQELDYEKERERRRRDREFEREKRRVEDIAEQGREVRPRDKDERRDGREEDRKDARRFQVDDDAFQTPLFSTPKRPLTPNVVTVEPDFSRLEDSSFERGRKPGRDGSEDEARDASHIYEAATHATGPVSAAPMASAIAAVELEERDMSRGRSTEPRSPRDASTGEKDPVQQEADRYYRELVLARHTEEERSRSSSPGGSVVEKWKEDEGEPVIRIVTPPEMEHKKQDKGRYDAPNADVRIDNVIVPRELVKYKVPEEVAKDSSLPVAVFKSRDPSCERERPLLNLVLPTPVPTPTPEKAEARKAAAKTETPPKDTQELKEKGPEIIIGPKGEIVEVPSTPTKSVSWGENETKRYEVESPERPQRSRGDIFAENETAAAEKPTTRSTKKSSSGWGILAAAVSGMATAAIPHDGEQSDEGKKIDKPQEKEPPKRTDSGSPPKDRKVLPRGTSARALQDEPEDLPPVPGPKPASPRSSPMPGAFADDIDFAATLAAGLHESGFDPNIVIEDATYRRRDSPPGSNGAGPYQQPFAETVTDLGVYSVEENPALRAIPEPGRVIGEVETPTLEKDLPSTESKRESSELGKKKRPKREETATADKDLREEVGDASKPDDDAKSVPEPDDSFKPAKLSKKELRQQKKRGEIERAAQPAEEEDTFYTPDPTPSEPAEVGEEEWAEAPSKKSKKSKKSKRTSSSWAEEDDATPTDDRRISVPVDAFDDIKEQVVAPDEEWDVKKSKKKSKRDSASYDSPSKSESRSEVGSEVSSSGTSKRSKKDRRKSGQDYDILDEEPPDKPSRRRESYRPVERDVSSVASDPAARYDDRYDGRSNGSRRDDDDNETIVSAATDPPRRKSSRSDKRSSKEEKRSSGSSFLDYFKPSGGKDSGKQDSPRSKDGKKDQSFLDNAGTVGASAGVAGVAAALAAGLSRAKATDAPSEQQEQHDDEIRPAERPTTPSRDIGIVDPEIVQKKRAVKPAIDPEYWDYLPLPPSEPGSPHWETEDLPPLPESRPETPPEQAEQERALLREKLQTHARRRSTQSAHETPMKSPSHTAIPIQFRIGHHRSSPIPVRSSPAGPASPSLIIAAPEAESTPTPRRLSSMADSGSTPTPKRPSRPTSWDGGREIRPLLLVKQAHAPETEAAGYAYHGNDMPLHVDTSVAGSSQYAIHTDSLESTPQTGTISSRTDYPHSQSRDVLPHEMAKDVIAAPAEVSEATQTDEFENLSELPALPPSEVGSPLLEPQYPRQEIEDSLHLSNSEVDLRTLSATGTPPLDASDEPELPKHSPAPVEPMSKDRSSYLLHSTPPSIRKAIDGGVLQESPTPTREPVVEEGSPTALKSLVSGAAGGLLAATLLGEDGHRDTTVAEEPSVAGKPAQLTGHEALDDKLEAVPEEVHVPLESVQQAAPNTEQAAEPLEAAADEWAEPKTLRRSKKKPRKSKASEADLDVAAGEETSRAVEIPSDQSVQEATEMTAIQEEPQFPETIRGDESEPTAAGEDKLGDFQTREIVAAAEEEKAPTLKRSASKKEKKKKGKKFSTWDPDEPTKDITAEQTESPPEVTEELGNTALETPQLGPSDVLGREVTVPVRDSETDLTSDFASVSAKKGKKKKKGRKSLDWEADVPVEDEPGSRASEPAIPAEEAQSLPSEQSTLAVSEELPATTSISEDTTLCELQEESQLPDFAPVSSKKSKKKKGKKYTSWEPEEPEQDITSPQPEEHESKGDAANIHEDESKPEAVESAASGAPAGPSTLPFEGDDTPAVESETAPFANIGKKRKKKDKRRETLSWEPEESVASEEPVVLEDVAPRQEPETEVFGSSPAVPAEEGEASSANRELPAEEAMTPQHVLEGDMYGVQSGRQQLESEVLESERDRLDVPKTSASQPATAEETLAVPVEKAVSTGEPEPEPQLGNREAPAEPGPLAEPESSAPAPDSAASMPEVPRDKEESLPAATSTPREDDDSHDLPSEQDKKKYLPSALTSAFGAVGSLLGMASRRDAQAAEADKPAEQQQATAEGSTPNDEAAAARPDQTEALRGAPTAPAAPDSATGAKAAGPSGAPDKSVQATPSRALDTAVLVPNQPATAHGSTATERPPGQPPAAELPREDAAGHLEGESPRPATEEVAPDVTSTVTHGAEDAPAAAVTATRNNEPEPNAAAAATAADDMETIIEEPEDASTVGEVAPATAALLSPPPPAEPAEPTESIDWEQEVASNKKKDKKGKNKKKKGGKNAQDAADSETPDQPSSTAEAEAAQQSADVDADAAKVTEASQDDLWPEPVISGKKAKKSKKKKDAPQPVLAEDEPPKPVVAEESSRPAEAEEEPKPVAEAVQAADIPESSTSAPTEEDSTPKSEDKPIEEQPGPSKPASKKSKKDKRRLRPSRSPWQSEDTDDAGDSYATNSTDGTPFDAEDLTRPTRLVPFEDVAQEQERLERESEAEDIWDTLKKRKKGKKRASLLRSWVDDSPALSDSAPSERQPKESSGDVTGQETEAQDFGEVQFETPTGKKRHSVTFDLSREVSPMGTRRPIIDETQPTKSLDEAPQLAASLEAVATSDDAKAATEAGPGSEVTPLAAEEVKEAIPEPEQVDASTGESPLPLPASSHEPEKSHETSSIPREETPLVPEVATADEPARDLQAEKAIVSPVTGLPRGTEIPTTSADDTAVAVAGPKETVTDEPLGDTSTSQELEQPIAVTEEEFPMAVKKSKKDKKKRKSKAWDESEPTSEAATPKEEKAEPILSSEPATAPEATTEPSQGDVSITGQSATEPEQPVAEDDTAKDIQPVTAPVSKKSKKDKKKRKSTAYDWSEPEPASEPATPKEVTELPSSTSETVEAPATTADVSQDDLITAEPEQIPDTQEGVSAFEPVETFVTKKSKKDKKKKKSSASLPWDEPSETPSATEEASQSDKPEETAAKDVAQSESVPAESGEPAKDEDFAAVVPTKKGKKDKKKKRLSVSWSEPESEVQTTAAEELPSQSAPAPEETVPRDETPPTDEGIMPKPEVVDKVDDGDDTVIVAGGKLPEDTPETLHEVMPRSELEDKVDDLDDTIIVAGGKLPQSVEKSVPEVSTPTPTPDDQRIQEDNKEPPAPAKSDDDDAAEPFVTPSEVPALPVLDMASEPKQADEAPASAGLDDTLSDAFATPAEAPPVTFEEQETPKATDEKAETQAEEEAPEFFVSEKSKKDKKKKKRGAEPQEAEPEGSSMPETPLEEAVEQKEIPDVTESPTLAEQPVEETSGAAEDEWSQPISTKKSKKDKKKAKKMSVSAFESEPEPPSVPETPLEETVEQTEAADVTETPEQVDQPVQEDDEWAALVSTKKSKKDKKKAKKMSLSGPEPLSESPSVPETPREDNIEQSVSEAHAPADQPAEETSGGAEDEWAELVAPKKSKKDKKKAKKMSLSAFESEPEPSSAPAETAGHPEEEQPLEEKPAEDRDITTPAEPEQAVLAAEEPKLDEEFPITRKMSKKEKRKAEKLAAAQQTEDVSPAEQEQAVTETELPYEKSLEASSQDQPLEEQQQPDVSDKSTEPAQLDVQESDKSRSIEPEAAHDASEEQQIETPAEENWEEFPVVSRKKSKKEKRKSQKLALAGQDTQEPKAASSESQEETGGSSAPSGERILPEEAAVVSEPLQMDSAPAEADLPASKEVEPEEFPFVTRKMSKKEKRKAKNKSLSWDEEAAPEPETAETPTAAEPTTTSEDVKVEAPEPSEADTSTAAADESTVVAPQPAEEETAPDSLTREQPVETTDDAAISESQEAGADDFPVITRKMSKKEKRKAQKLAQSEPESASNDVSESPPSQELVSEQAKTEDLATEATEVATQESAEDASQSEGKMAKETDVDDFPMPTTRKMSKKEKKKAQKLAQQQEPEPPSDIREAVPSEDLPLLTNPAAEEPQDAPRTAPADVPESVEPEPSNAEPEPTTAKEAEPDDFGFPITRKKSKKEKKRKGSKQTDSLPASGAQTPAVEEPGPGNSVPEAAPAELVVTAEEASANPDDVFPDTPAKKSKKDKKGRKGSAIVELEKGEPSSSTLDESAEDHGRHASQPQTGKTPDTGDVKMLEDVSKDSDDKSRSSPGHEQDLVLSTVRPDVWDDESYFKPKAATGGDNPPSELPFDRVEIHPAVARELAGSPEKGMGSSAAERPMVGLGLIKRHSSLFREISDHVPKLLTIVSDTPSVESVGTPGLLSPDATPRAEFPESTGSGKLPEVDLTPAQTSSNIAHDLPFDSSIGPEKRAKTRDLEDTPVPGYAPPVREEKRAGEEETTSHTPAEGQDSPQSSAGVEVKPETGPGDAAKVDDGKPLPSGLSAREIAATFLEGGIHEKLDVKEGVASEPASYQSDDKKPSTHQIAATFLDPQKSKPTATEKEESTTPTGGLRKRPSAREIAASFLENERQPNKSKQETEVAVAAGAAAGSVASLAQKFGGSKKSKGKKKGKKVLEMKQDDSVFNDPSLWEGAERRPLEGSRMDVDAAGFWDVPETETAGEQEITQKDEKMKDAEPAEATSDTSASVTPPVIARDAPVIERSVTPNPDVAGHEEDHKQPTDVLSRDVEMDIGHHAATSRELPVTSPMHDKMADVGDTVMKSIEPMDDDLSHHDYPPVVDFGRSKSRGLPPVREESQEEEEHEAEKQETRNLKLASDTNRDSGFVTASPHLSQHSYREDDQQRDSGVHLREFPENSPKLSNRGFSPDRAGRPRSSLREEQKDVSHEQGRDETPRAEDKTLKRSALSEADKKRQFRAGTPVLQGPPEQPRTPEPRKLDSAAAASSMSTSSKPRSKYPDLTPVAAVGAGTLAAAAAVTGARSVSDSTSHRLSPQPQTVPRRSASNTSISRMRTPEPLNLRPDSPGIRRSSATPPLRLKRASGDLRQRSQTDLAAAKDAPDPTRVTTPVANEGRVRTKDMADVYDGYGEGRIGSPRSPTRPHSMRRRQSMQVLELESKVDQLLAENRLLNEARAQAESHLSTRAASLLAERDAEIDNLKQLLTTIRSEVERLTEVNEGLNSANAQLAVQHNEKYRRLETEHAEASRELLDVRGRHGNYEKSLEEKDAEIQSLREQLRDSEEQIRALQRQILATKPPDADFLNLHDVDYFDHRCQQLCSHVQQWVLRFSKFSDMRACRLTREINDEKIIDRLDNAVLDGSDVDDYLADRVRRRDIFMSMTMNMIWEFVFTRYLFGMDREQRQKLKSLEKLLLEVGPPQAVRQWRAVTLTLLSRRDAFAAQRDQDTEAVVQAVLQTLSAILPPPSNLEDQIQQQLRRVMREAVDLSVEMRTQRAEYMMLPPLQPEYDASGELAETVTFNASLMNERSGASGAGSSNDELQAAGAVVRVVLFPLVVRKGDDDGVGDEEVVVCPAQVLVARPATPASRRSIRMVTPSSDAGGVSLYRGGSPSTAPNRSNITMQEAPPPEAEYLEGGI
ncbi:Involucrin repeat protein [Pleurostoma richardsiae]|uniref:Involucrin repeat protein n=1 Tax=Pleurostoma richardsiae TaxID=41990 RepID=A0AA38RLD6_9PEZI|nr:Involucrin repeat protein [Pleurostoma richardsiae]